jgi:hypothetical protein
MFDTMSDTQMNNLLSELGATSFWQAVLRFNRTKDAQAINSLASTDPFKDPTSMARTQGIRMGLYYLEQEINRKNEAKNKLEEEQGEE